MIAATFVCSLNEVGDGQNTTWVPPVPIGNAASPAVRLSVALIAGKLQVAVPAGSVGFAYVPTLVVGVAVQKTLAFTSTDVGGPMSTTLPTPYDWQGALTPPTAVWISASAPESGTIYFF